MTWKMAHDTDFQLRIWIIFAENFLLTLNIGVMLYDWIMEIIMLL